MTLFGISLWRIILIVVLIFLVVQRANLVAAFAKFKYARGRYQEAMRIFLVADKIGNMNLNNKVLLGYVCLRCGEVAEAKKALTMAAAMARPKTANCYKVKSLLALVYWKEEDLELAIETLEEIVEDGFVNTSIYQNLGVLYNLKGDLEKAEKFNVKAYEYNKDDAIICDNLADTYAQMQEYGKAEEIYEDLMHRDPPPRFPEAYYGYGKVLIALGKKEEGVKKIEEALEKPFSALSIHTKEEVEEMLRKFQEA